MNITRRGALTLFGGFGLAGLAACGSSSDNGSSSTASGTATGPVPGKTYKIGICQFVTHPSLDAVREGAIKALAAAGYVDKQNAKIDYQNPQTDQATLTNIANTFASNNMDLVIAIATPSALAMAQAITSKPVLFAAVTDPVKAGLVKSWDAPGGNVTGTSDLNPIDKQLGLVKEVVPDAKTVGIVYSSAEANSGVQVKMAQDASGAAGLTIKTATVTNSSEIQQAAQSLDVDAFFVPTDNTVVSGLEALLGVAITKKVPVISCDGDSVKRGATASYALEYSVMGTMTGQMAVRLLQGADPATMPVETQKDPKLTINPGAAAKVGITLSKDLTQKADVTIK